MTNDKLLEEVSLALYKHSGWNDWENEQPPVKSEWHSRAQAAIDVMQKHMDERNEVLKEAVVELRGISDELKHLEGVYK